MSRRWLAGFLEVCKKIIYLVNLADINQPLAGTVLVLYGVQGTCRLLYCMYRTVKTGKEEVLFFSDVLPVLTRSKC